MVKTFTMAEVNKHNTQDDLWLLIDGKVYDVTKFFDEHPGGGDTLLQSTGTATSQCNIRVTLIVYNCIGCALMELAIIEGRSCG